MAEIEGFFAVNDFWITFVITQPMEELKNRVFTRYSLQSLSMRAGAFRFFCLTEDPYKKAIDGILQESITSSLRKDLIAVIGDFNKVYHKESELVDVEQD